MNWSIIFIVFVVFVALPDFHNEVLGEFLPKEDPIPID